MERRRRWQGGKGETGKGDDREMQAPSGWTSTWYTWHTSWAAPPNSWAPHHGSSWKEGFRWQEHRPENRPPWMGSYNSEQEDDFETRCATIEQWQRFRQDFDLDDPAWKVLILLAQRCPAGYRKAADIVNGVYEMRENDETPDSASKVVMHKVRGAREQLDPR